MRAKLFEANDVKIYQNSDPYMDNGSLIFMGNIFYAYLLHSGLIIKEALLAKSFGFPIWNIHGDGPEMELEAKPIPRHYNSLSTRISTDSYYKYTGHISGIWRGYV